MPSPSDCLLSEDNMSAYRKERPSRSFVLFSALAKDVERQESHLREGGKSSLDKVLAPFVIDRTQVLKGRGGVVGIWR